MNKELVEVLKKQIDLLKTDDTPKLVFIGGIPGAGKTALISRVKKDFYNSEFQIIDSDLYRNFFSNNVKVEDTVEYANFVENELLKYSIDNNKNIISISTIRAYHYINQLILKATKYDVYFFVMLTNEIESSLSAYERYLYNQESEIQFSRLLKYSYMKTAIDGFMNSLVNFSKTKTYGKFIFFVRGITSSKEPKKIKISQENLLKDIDKVLIEQKKKIKRKDIEKRINAIESKLSKEERKEFKLICDNFICFNSSEV